MEGYNWSADPDQPGATRSDKPVDSASGAGFGLNTG
jgi:hypothetical protein